MNRNRNTSEMRDGDVEVEYLRSICCVNNYSDKNRFVGVSIENGKPKVCFPLGFRLSSTVSGIRKDIFLLFRVLERFSKRDEGISMTGHGEDAELPSFPFAAYRLIIKDFFRRGCYYADQVSAYKNNLNGVVSWSKTFRKNTPHVTQDGTLYYDKYVTKSLVRNENELITRIHKYCVYIAFTRVGWLFSRLQMPKFSCPARKERMVDCLRQKLSSSNISDNRLLFDAMLQVIENDSSSVVLKDFSYGTSYFEHIWERLIDYSFSNTDKREYFPRTEWFLPSLDGGQACTALEPDTIVEYENKIFIIDSKYYRYAMTGTKSHLPDSSSINKQLIYGEQVSARTDNAVYNAFLFPYDMGSNAVNGDSYIFCFGKASGSWKSKKKEYHTIVAVAMDTKSVMERFSKKEENIRLLCSHIEDYVARNIVNGSDLECSSPEEE